MYKTPIVREAGIKVNNSVVGETLENKIERYLANKEPLGDERDLIYTERADGIQQGYNIKADKWDIALDGIDKVQKSYKARGEEKIANETKVIDLNPEEDGKTEPTQG